VTHAAKLPCRTGVSNISDATPGYKVKVSVSVTSGHHAGSCSTSFTPHR
jgi:hypothetical protein